MPINNIFDRTDKTLARKLAKNKFGEFERNRNTLLQAVGTDFAKLVGPALIEAAKTILGKQTIQVAPPQVHIPAPIVNVQAPKAPDVYVPAPIANVTVPPIKIPDINIPQMKWPDGEMPIYGKVTLDGINEGNPLSVQIRDSKGRPVDFNLGSNIITSGGGGGIAKQVRINNTSDSPVPVTGSLTVAAAASTYVIPGNSEGVVYNSDNPLPVTITSGASATSGTNIVDSSGVAYTGSNPVPVAGAVTMATLPDTAAGDLAALVAGQLPDGHNVTVDNASIAVTGTFWQATQPVSGTVAVSAITNSVAAALVDSSGVQYSTSNPLPIDDAGGAITVDGTVAVSSITASTTAIIGDKRADEADGDSNPVKIGGVARTANPTAVGAGDRVSATFDDLGRQLIRPVQVRDLTSTAYVSVANGTETTLFTGATNTYHDLIYVLASNNSTAAVGVDIRGTLAGNVIMHLEVPANGVVGVATPVPIPAGDVGASWTVDLPDITGTTVYVSALFSKEV